jgi:hypothetical protein
VLVSRHAWIARDADFGGLDSFELQLQGDLATPDVAERLSERLSELGSVSRPGPGDVTSYLEQLATADGPLATAVYIDVETEVEDGGVVVRGSLRAYSDDEYPRLRASITDIVEAELGASGHVFTFRDAPNPLSRGMRRVTPGPPSCPVHGGPCLPSPSGTAAGLCCGNVCVPSDPCLEPRELTAPQGNRE